MPKEINLKSLVKFVHNKYLSDIEIPKTLIVLYSEGGNSIMSSGYWNDDEIGEKFIITVIPALKEKNLRNFKVIVGGIAYEFGHLVQYRRNVPWPHNEKEVDDMVIGRGLGKYLMHTKEYLKEWNPNFQFKGYTSEEIFQKI